MNRISHFLATGALALLGTFPGPLAGKAQAVQPPYVLTLLMTEIDPVEEVEETTGTLARLDGSVFVCSQNGGSWTVDEYAPSRYAVENGTTICAYDVTHIADSESIARAVLDAPNGDPMPVPEERTNSQYVIFVGRIVLTDDEDNVVLDTYGTYIVAGDGRIQFSPEQ